MKLHWDTLYSREFASGLRISLIFCHIMATMLLYCIILSKHFVHTTFHSLTIYSLLCVHTLYIIHCTLWKFYISYYLWVTYTAVSFSFLILGQQTRHYIKWTKWISLQQLMVLYSKQFTLVIILFVEYVKLKHSE